MIWKTDWTANNNHARNGSKDIDRLIGNYATLRTQLIEYGHIVPAKEIITNGYYTYAFADLLNAVEYNLAGLDALKLPDWIDKDVTWMPAAAGLTFEDINRWEQNGLMLEDAITHMTAAFLLCGDPDAYCGYLATY